MTAIILRRKRLGKGSTNGVASASVTGIKVVRNWVSPDWGGVDHEGSVIFRWGCTSPLPEGVLASVVNTAKSIHWCSDKRQGRLNMQAAGVPVPETWNTENFISEMNNPEGSLREDQFFVARPATHAQGKQLESGSGTRLIVGDKLYPAGYVSRLIAKVAEYRVMVVSNRVAWVAQKTPGNPDDVAWNVARGGRFDNVRWGEWPVRVIRAALAAAKVSGCDFCGVDVMVDADGNPYVLEVNSAPSQTSPYRQQCLAKCFDYIVENGKDPFDDNVIRSWKDVIHPMVWNSSRD